VRVCTVAGCVRASRGRGWCPAHYNYWWRTGADPSAWVPYESFTPLRALDLLESDGGWLTKHAVADRLQAEVNTTYRALLRLRERGLAVSRPAPWSTHPVVNEWRAS